MADVAHDLQSEFWQAPLPAKTQSPEADECSAFIELPACPGCGAEFMMDSHFCYSCGTKRPSDLAGETAHGWHGAVAAMLDNTRSLVSACAKGVRSTISALPSILPAMSLSAVRRQTGLGTAPLAAFSVGIVCCLVAVFLAFSGTHEPGTLMLAAHLERIEWLIGGTAAFAAGLLLKKRSGD